MSPYDVVIIGGGLGGCSAAITLASHGWQVLVLEKTPRPTHKLCGEFLSSEARGYFHRLGVLEAVLAAGAHPIHRTVVTSPSGALWAHALPGTGLGLSRLRLDALLIARVREAGAEVQEGCVAERVEGGLDNGFTVHTREGALACRLVLGAYGKRTTLDRRLGRACISQTSPYVAFKGHFEGQGLTDEVALHGIPGGYCGLSRIEGGRVNACWITTTTALKAAGGTAAGMVEQAFGTNPRLADNMTQLTPVFDRYLSVGQLLFVPKGAFAGGVMMVGDAAGMIAPLCGDGMSMALRGGELAATHAGAYLSGQRPAPAFVREYARAWAQEFAPRMRLGRWMHAAYADPGGARLGHWALRHVPGLGRWMIRNTRAPA